MPKCFCPTCARATWFRSQLTDTQVRLADSAVDKEYALRRELGWETDRPLILAAEQAVRARTAQGVLAV
jgi:hypothetical protein